MNTVIASGHSSPSASSVYLPPSGSVCRCGTKQRVNYLYLLVKSFWKMRSTRSKLGELVWD
jgi:hypothetical protein